MGKGLSQRHRIKQAKKANEGNLRKAVSPHSALVHLPHQPAALWARMPLLSSVIDRRPCLPCLTGTCMIAMQQLGKGGATPYLPLPQAPKSEEFIDRVPRSLQKLMALKVRVPDERTVSWLPQRLMMPGEELLRDNGALRESLVHVTTR